LALAIDENTVITRKSFGIFEIIPVKA